MTVKCGSAGLLPLQIHESINTHRKLKKHLKLGYNISTGHELNLHPEFLDEAKGWLGWHSSYLEEILSGDLLEGEEILSPGKTLAWTFHQTLLLLRAAHSDTNTHRAADTRERGTCVSASFTRSHPTIPYLPQLKHERLWNVLFQAIFISPN